MKKIISIVSVLILIFTLVSCTQQAPEDKKTANPPPSVTVNGEKISDEEYEYFRKIIRSEIITEYAEKYSITDFETFWETEFDGKTPTAELEDRTIAKCVRAKIELNMCKDKGIYEDVTFAGLKAKAEQFNAENANKSGVVGLKSIAMNSFYTYYIDTGVMELKNRLEKDELKPSDAEIQAQTQNMTDDVKSELTEEEIHNSAFDKAVNEKYEKLIEQKISEAEIIKR